ncbi:hypothetical protein [Microcella sp.]|uniref:hypothetical protein n=1 Tax=Microcella sp. TaxID=1913979 RepID=UPI003F730D59
MQRPLLRKEHERHPSSSDFRRRKSGFTCRFSSPGYFLRTPAERSGRYRELLAMLAADALDVRIGARFPLADAGVAQAALASRGTTGMELLTR